MRNREYDRAKVIKYLLWTFGLAYVIQFGAAYVYNHINRQIGQLVIAAMMFVPALSVLLAGEKLNDMGWKPQLRRNLKTILTAWFTPVILTVLGAALYFLVFPGHFDLSGEFLAVSGGTEALRQLEAQGISYPMYILISMVSIITYAPLINAFVASGEEIGWRGFLYPQLKAGFGRTKGWILGGILWGMWHWPLIWLIGYEYGAAAANEAGYWGFPFSGMILFCVITVGWGILHDWLYEKSGSIWVPSLFHGAINAAASLPLTVCLTNTGTARLLGPAPNGLLSALPFLICAAVLLRSKKNSGDRSGK